MQTLNQALFIFFALLAVASAILMVTRRNIVHGAVFLITTLLSTAGIFLLLQAEFLFIVQVILYVGGIMVLFVFVIMLVNLDVSMRQVQFNRQWFVAGALALVLAAQILVRDLGGAGRAAFAGDGRRDFAEKYRGRGGCAFSAITCCRLRSLRFCCWWR